MANLANLSSARANVMASPLILIGTKALLDAQHAVQAEQATIRFPFSECKRLGQQAFAGTLVHYLFDLERRGIEPTVGAGLPAAGDYRALRAWHAAQLRRPARPAQGPALQAILRRQQKFLHSMPYSVMSPQLRLQTELDEFKASLTPVRLPTTAPAIWRPRKPNTPA